MLLTAPQRGERRRPDKFCAFVSIDSGLWKMTQCLEFSHLRSLSFGFCLFLAVLGIFNKLGFEQESMSKVLRGGCA